MASIYDDIRSTLEVTLNSIAGLPHIKPENVSYKPTNGTPYISTKLVPTKRVPAHRGDNPQMFYKGVFRIFCHIPSGTAPGDADDMADLIIEALDATTDVSWVNPDTAETTIVSIDYAEREEGIEENSFYYVPVNIGWYIYS